MASYNVISRAMPEGGCPIAPSRRLKENNERSIDLPNGAFAQRMVFGTALFAVVLVRT